MTPIAIIMTSDGHGDRIDAALARPNHGIECGGTMPPHHAYVPSYDANARAGIRFPGTAYRKNLERSMGAVARSRGPNHAQSLIIGFITAIFALANAAIIDAINKYLMPPSIFPKTTSSSNGGAHGRGPIGLRIRHGRGCGRRIEQPPRTPAPRGRRDSQSMRRRN